MDTLISCELAGARPDAVIIGIQPGDWRTLSPALTPELEARLPGFCAKVVAELARRGITATPRERGEAAAGA